MSDKSKNQSAEIETAGPYTPPEISEIGTIEDLTFGSDTAGLRDGTNIHFNNYSYPS